MRDRGGGDAKPKKACAANVAGSYPLSRLDIHVTFPPGPSRLGFQTLIFGIRS